jgi:hypothetical protein
MATIHLTDQFGLDVTLSPGPASVLSRYLRELTTVGVSLNGGKDIRTITVAEYPFKSESIGLSFQQPVNLGASGVELTISPEVSGSLRVAEGSDLVDSALYDLPAFQPLMSQTYLSAAIEASLAADLEDEAGALQFGLNTGSDVVLSYSELVKPTDQLVPAIEEVVGSFSIPGELEDLRGLPVGSVASVEGSGKLKLSTAIDVLTATNPLATVATAALPLAKINLREGASISVGAALSLMGGYKVRVSKLDADRVWLGYSRTRGKEFDTSVTAGVDVSAAVGSFDIITILLQAISPDAAPSVDDLKKAGLEEDEITAISAAIKAGIERSLEVAWRAELDFSDEHTSAFLYEIDLAALDDAARRAVQSALRGDLSEVERGPLAGVKALRSMTRMRRDRARKLNLNLLGVLNVGSMTELVQNSTVIVDPDTGDITIADKTTASEIGLTVNNFAQNAAKLRHILADGFLTTCVYRTSQTGAKVNINSRCWAFELRNTTSFQQIQGFMNLAASLGLISSDDATRKLGALGPRPDQQQYGRSVFFADSGYDDAVFYTLFFDKAGQVRPQAFYEKVGRDAMAATLPPRDPAHRARLLPLTNDEVWQAMSGGQTTFPALFARYGFNSVEVADITGDYSIIVWWSSAMRSMGQALASLLACLKNTGMRETTNNTFASLREDLNKKVKAVSQQTHDRFSEPWGLVAMDMASGRRSQTNLLVALPGFNLSLSREEYHDAT